MDYYPVFLNLRGKKVVVIGGGSVAERRIKQLLKCGAVLHLYSKKISKKILNYRNIKIHKRFSSSILDGSTAVFVATDDKEFNRKLLVDATIRKIPINLSDDPKNSTFIVPSILKKGDITIAISTGGKAPALSKAIRRVLELIFGKELTLLTRGIEALRNKVKKRLHIKTERIKILKEGNLEGLLQNIMGSNKKEAKKHIHDYLNREEERIDKILRNIR